jgi:hypothetical protein
MWCAQNRQDNLRAMIHPSINALLCDATLYEAAHFGDPCL